MWLERAHAAVNEMLAAMTRKGTKRGIAEAPCDIRGGRVSDDQAVPDAVLLCYHIPLDRWNCSSRSRAVPRARRAPAANHNWRARMQHALMYQGSFEKNYSGLQKGAS